MSDDEQPRIYILRLRALRGADAIRQLRALLKRALRSHGFRCLSVYEEIINDKSEPE
jgi:hypothetical protein